MKRTYQMIYGIDVSKDQLDICIVNTITHHLEYKRIPNKPPNIKEWLSKIKHQDALCVIEHTGSYSSWLLDCLWSNEIKTVAVNPNQSHHYMKALGMINKNDQQSAKALALK